MEDFLKKISDFLINSGLRFLLACLIIFVGFKLIKFLISRIAKGRGFQRIDPSAQSFIKSFVNIAAKIIIVITAAAVMGVPMTSMTAIIGSAGLAIGLALQGGLSNLAGGFLLLVFKPFTLGEYIKTADGYEGTVVKIDIFYTTLKMADNTKIVILHTDGQTRFQRCRTGCGTAQSASRRDFRRAFRKWHRDCRLLF